MTHFNDSYDDSSKDESKMTEFLFVNKFLCCSLNNSHLHFKNDLTSYTEVLQDFVNASRMGTGQDG